MRCDPLTEEEEEEEENQKELNFVCVCFTKKRERPSERRDLNI